MCVCLVISKIGASIVHLVPMSSEQACFHGKAYPAIICSYRRWEECDKHKVDITLYKDSLPKEPQHEVSSE